MINSEFRKKMADSWFSYLQMQICKSFEQLENNKLQFTKRDWHKKKVSEGGGTSYLLTGGKIFDKVGVNKSTVSGVFPKKFRSKILGAEKKGKYWASGVSVVAHMKNPKIPAIHFNTRFIVTSKEWFGGGMDVTPSHYDKKEKKLIHEYLKKICLQNKIPTAKFKNCINHKQVKKFLSYTKLPVVVKALRFQAPGRPKLPPWQPLPFPRQSLPVHSQIPPCQVVPHAWRPEPNSWPLPPNPALVQLGHFGPWQGIRAAV